MKLLQLGLTGATYLPRMLEAVAQMRGTPAMEYDKVAQNDPYPARRPMQIDALSFNIHDCSVGWCHTDPSAKDCA